MESLQPLAIAVISKLIDVLAKKRIVPKPPARQQMVGNLEQHLVKVQNWSKRIQFTGMSSAESTDESTVPLMLDAVPRRFSGSKIQAEKLSEANLLESADSYLILGAPGSGKTTTLKRLARMVLLSPPVSSTDLWQYPIVLRLREAKPGFSVNRLIADELGIKYQKRSEDVFDREAYIRALGNVKSEREEGRFVAHESETESRQRDDWSRHSLMGSQEWDEREARLRAMKTVEDAFIGDKRLDQILPTLLDETFALILLDGLDEVLARDRIRVKEEIAALARRLSYSKIIMTARSGEVSFVEGFDIVEICPLDDTQISLVAGKWLGEPESFLAKLRSVPFQDLANRPLFLAHLMVFYRTKGYLPEQASDIYQKIITLILEEWDAQRGIRRGTSYAGFSAEKKLEFLASVAFHLTYKLNLKTFRARDLIEAYEKVHAVFNLPRDQAREVAVEIETHTGLIAEAADAAYEFSHLSLQEYLCAYYLVRAPLSPEVHAYLIEYSQPIAVAVSLSSSPSRWLADLILRTPGFFKLSGEPVKGFIERLVLEQPRFEKSVLLGFAFLQLIFAFGIEIAEPVVRLSKVGERLGYSLAHSLADALRFYSIDFFASTDDKWWIEKFMGPPKIEDHPLPEKGFVPLSLLKHLQHSVGLALDLTGTNNQKRGGFK